MPDEIKAQNLTKNPQAGQPGEKPNLAGRLALVILVLAALAVAGYFGLKDGRDQQAGKQTDNKNVAAQNKSKQEAPKPADLQAQALLGNSQIEGATSTPEVQKSIPNNNIPALLQPLVLEGAMDLKADKASFNGQAGVLLTYTLPKSDIANAFNILGSKMDTSWQRLKQLRADLFALIELQKGQQKISIQIKQNSQSGVSVEIKFLQ